MVAPRVMGGVVFLNVVTLLVLVGSAWQTGDEDRLGDQVVWLDAAVLALIVCGAANALGIAAARRAITDRARTLLGPAHPGRLP